MTNADKIRQMTDEELLEWVAGLSNACMDYDIERCGDYKTCRECWKDRLPLTGRAPVLIELFARRYCPPPLFPEGRRNKEMEDDKR